mmetsp:Transcript_28195/g.45960  ORF Transcript_28195/g.45960 Transcript_28195/m.45960 type:complete len:104 (-) Transcript_28195:289-600(-)
MSMDFVTTRMSMRNQLLLSVIYHWENIEEFIPTRKQLQNEVVVAEVDKFWVIIFHFMLKRRKKKKNDDDPSLLRYVVGCSSIVIKISENIGRRHQACAPPLCC